MATFTPTVINNTTPALQVTITGTQVTYQQFVNSLGKDVYLVNELYTSANSINQLIGGVQYYRYDANGNAETQYLTPTADPYQSQNALYYKTRGRDVILNGRSSFGFNLLPAELVGLTLYTDRYGVSEMLDFLHLNNFKAIESSMGEFKFFDYWEKRIE